MCVIEIIYLVLYLRARRFNLNTYLFLYCYYHEKNRFFFCFIIAIILCFKLNAQSLEKTNNLKIEVEAGYLLNSLKISSPNHFAVDKGWLYPKNSFFCGLSFSKPFRYFNVRFLARNNRFIYVDESFTLPKSYIFTKTDFVQFSPSIEKSLLKKLSIIIGVDFNIFVHRNNTNKGTGKVYSVPKPLFENIYYSSKLSSIVYGLNFGVKYNIKNFGFFINSQIPINAAANYLVLPPNTGGNRNHLQFYYSNINLGTSFSILPLPRRLKQPIGY
jgi:hypothetical protein